MRRGAVLLVNFKALLKSKFWRLISYNLKRPRLLLFPSSRIPVSPSEAHGNLQYALGKRQAATGQEGTRSSTRSSSYWGCFPQASIYNYLFPSVSIYFSYKAACRTFVLHEICLWKSLTSGFPNEAAQRGEKGAKDNFCVTFVTSWAAIVQGLSWSLGVPTL